MERLKKQVFLLSLLLLPASCLDQTADWSICYILDGILISYCIIVTTLFLKEKVSFQPSQTRGSEVESHTNPEPVNTENRDPYQDLEPTKRKRKIKKKNNSDTTNIELTNGHQLERLFPVASSSSAQ